MFRSLIEKHGFKKQPRFIMKKPKNLKCKPTYQTNRINSKRKSNFTEVKSVLKEYLIDNKRPRRSEQISFIANPDTPSTGSVNELPEKQDTCHKSERLIEPNNENQIFEAENENFITQTSKLSNSVQGWNLVRRNSPLQLNKNTENMQNAAEIPDQNASDNRHHQVIHSIEMLEKAVKIAAERNGISLNKTKLISPTGTSFDEYTINHDVNQDYCYERSPSIPNKQKSTAENEESTNFEKNNISASNTLICEEDQLLKELDALQKNFPTTLRQKNEGEAEKESNSRLKLSTIKELESLETKQLSDAISNFQSK